MDNKYIIEKSKDGYDILQIFKDNKKIYLGSKYNEEREINKVINLCEPIGEYDNYIIWGLGMANHVIKLSKLISSKSRILVVECDTAIIKLNKNYNLISKLKNLKNVDIATNNEEVMEFLYKYINEYNVNNLKMVPYCNYNKYYMVEITPIYKCVKDYASILYTNSHVNKKYADEFFESKIKNSKFLNKSGVLLDYKNKHKGKPAIIVSAGPSLSKNIKYLESCKNSIIISSGRTLKSLLNINIDPHYTVIMDPNKWSCEIVYDYIDKTNSKLVYDLGIKNDILTRHRGVKVVSTEDIDVEKIVNKKIGHLKVGGSVAHAMVEFAALLGCNPIIFIGQDLAYTDDKCHADIAKSTWGSNESKNYINDDDLFIEGINGELIRTSKALNTFRIEMERIISRHKNIKFINCTEGGANIKGASNEKLKDILIKYDNKIIKQNNENNKLLIDENKITKRVVKNINYSIENIVEIINIINKEMQIIRIYEKNLNNENIEILKDNLTKVEYKIKKLTEKIIFSKDLLYPIFYEINNNNEYIIYNTDSEYESIKKLLNKNMYFYKNINKKLEYAKNLMESVVEELCDKF